MIEGTLFFSFQASCIDSTAAPEAVFADEVKKLQSEKLKPKEQITLEPYERDHAIVVGNYRLVNILRELLALINLSVILDRPARARVRMTALKKPWKNNCIGKLCSTILCRLSMPVICTVLFLLLIKNNKHICETEKRRKQLSIDMIDGFSFDSAIRGDVLDQQRLMTYFNWWFFFNSLAWLSYWWASLIYSVSVRTHQRMTTKKMATNALPKLTLVVRCLIANWWKMKIPLHVFRAHRWLLNKPLVSVVSGRSRDTMNRSLEYTEAFRLFDRDEDSFINAKELSLLIRSLERNPSDHEIQQLIDQIVDKGSVHRWLDSIASFSVFSQITTWSIVNSSYWWCPSYREIKSSTLGKNFVIFSIVLIPMRADTSVPKNCEWPCVCSSMVMMTWSWAKKKSTKWSLNSIPIKMDGWHSMVIEQNLRTRSSIIFWWHLDFAGIFAGQI